MIYINEFDEEYNKAGQNHLFPSMMIMLLRPITLALRNVEVITASTGGTLRQIIITTGPGWNLYCHVYFVIFDS